MPKRSKIKISVLIYALLISTLAHAGLVWGPGLFGIERAVKNAELPESIPEERVEIIHFYSGKQKVAPASEIPPIAPSKGKTFKEIPWITDDVTYASYIRGLIIENLKRLPSLKSKRERSVQVEFTLNRNGKMIGLNEKNQSDPYIRSAIQALTLASKDFPPFPDSVQKKEQNFSFTLLFSPNP